MTLWLVRNPSVLDALLHNRQANPWPFISLAVVLGVIPAGESRADLTYSVALQAEYSDNINRSATAAESELISSVLAGLTYNYVGPQNQARLTASGTYRDYRDETYSDSTSATFEANAEWFLVSRSFSWSVTDLYGQLLVNPGAPDTPDNRENYNIFATGPNLYMQLTDVDRVTTEARYGQLAVQNQDVDNARHFAALRWLHQFSQHTNLSLNYEYLDVRYDNLALGNDYRRDELFIRGTLGPTTSQFQADVGRTGIERREAAQLDGSTLRFRWSRRTTSASFVTLAVAREFSDTALELYPGGVATRTYTSSLGTAMVGGILVSEPFRVKRGEFVFATRLVELPTQLRVTRHDYEYETAIYSYRQTGAMLSSSYAPNSALSFGVSFRHEQTEYTETHSAWDDTEVSLSSVYRISPRVSGSLRLIRARRASDDPAQNYVDNRIMLALSYGVGARAAGTLTGAPAPSQ